MHKKRILCLIMVAILIMTGNVMPVFAAQLRQTSTSQEVSVVTPYIVSFENETGAEQGYDIDVMEAEKNQVIVPVYFQYSGIVSCALYCRTAVTTGTAVQGQDVRVAMYGDEACTAMIGSEQSSSLTQETEALYLHNFQVQSGDTCYMKISVSSEVATAAEHYDFRLMVQEYSNADRQVTYGNSMECWQSMEDRVYYKVPVEQAGLLSVNMNFEQSVHGNTKIFLCNSRKKRLSQVVTFASQNKEAVFAVKKGTYYLAVEKAEGRYQLSVNMENIKENSGATKKRAKKIKLGNKGVTGIVSVSASKKKYDWYCFTLKKPSKVKFDLVCSTTNNTKIKIEIIPPKKDRQGKYVRFEKDPMFTLNGIRVRREAKSDVWPSGTWYVKINKTQQKGSGKYSLKIKKVS